jgi:hypothetical protein
MPGDAVDAQQRGVLLVRRRRTESADDGVALAQVITANLVDRDVDVVGRRVVALGAQEAVAVVAQVEQTFDFDELAGVGLVGVGHGFAAAKRSRPPLRHHYRGGCGGCVESDCWNRCRTRGVGAPGASLGELDEGSAGRSLGATSPP